MKNDDIDNIENKFGKRYIPLQEFIQTLNNINSYNDDTVNSYIVGCMFITLLEDKSYFANAILNEPSELTLWQNELLKTHSNRTVINARIVFNGIFEDAFRDEIISKNPFSIIKAPKNIAKMKIFLFQKMKYLEF